MHTLLITNDFPPFWAGEAQYYYNIWKNLPAEDVIVLCPRIPGYEEFDRVQPFLIYRARGLLLPTFFGRLIKPFIYLFYTLHIIKKHRDISLIHCGNILSTFLSGLVASRLYKIPYFVYIFAEDLRGLGKIKIFRDFFVGFLNKSKRVIILSEFTKKRFAEKGVKEELFKAVYPGVDLDNFYPQDSQEAKRQFNLQDKKVILSVGRLAKRKGYDMVIKALPVVLEKVPNAVLVICGRGELEHQLKNLAKNYNVAEQVIFTGYVSNVQSLPLYYNACDVFIMPSREYYGVDAEGFGIVFIEAGACAKVAIGGRSGGIPDAVIDGVTGFLVDPLNVEDIANTIIKVLHNDALAKQLGENARKRIRKNFQWKLSAQILNNLTNESLA